MIRLLSLEAAPPDAGGLSAACAGPGNFLQSRFWGGFKARAGWRPFYFSARWDYSARAGDSVPAAAAETPAAPLLVLYRRLGPLFGFAYVPWGPEFTGAAAAWFPGVGERAGALAALAKALARLLPKDTVFIRFDLPWQTEDAALVDARTARRWLGPSFRRAAADVQPPDTVIIDLCREDGEARGDGELLAAMKSKWRYNIGLAGKKGVAVRRAGAGELPAFYALYRETARRDGIGIHAAAYYETFFGEAAKTAEAGAGNERVDARLYLASHEGEDIAGIITLFRGDEAIYLYGASANHKRNLMAPYALQWQAMRDARDAGCRFYDLDGIPPRPGEEDPAHPMAGLYRFKTGFGGRIVYRPGCHDYACRPLFAALYRAAEALRKKLRDARKRGRSRA